MADKESSELPILAAIATTYGIVILDPTDTSSQPESGPGGTLKTIPWSVILTALRTGTQDFSGASSVLVPTPTLSGQAATKGYADLMLPLAGGTMTGPLDLQAGTVNGLKVSDNLAGDVVLIDTGAAADEGIYRLRSSGEAFRIQILDDALAVVLEAMTINSTGQVRFDSALRVLVPEPDSADCAAQVTAINATTGQLAIGGIEMGDTGYRDVITWTSGVQDGSDQIDTLNASNWTPHGNGSIRLRRIGDRVQLGICQYATSTGNDLQALNTGYVQLFGNLPTGFQAAGRIFGPAANNDNFSTGVVSEAGRRTVAGDVYLNVTTAGKLANLFAEWVTADAWPTSLPGVAS